MEYERSHIRKSGTGEWIALVLCAAVLAAGILEQFVKNRPDYAGAFAPFWIPFAAAGFAAAGIARLNDLSSLLRLQRTLLWCGLLLMIWTANGLPFDLLRIMHLIPFGVDWPGLITRTLALAALVFLARIALAAPTASSSTRIASWYGYAAFVLALPYPLLRVCWAFGGTIGLSYAGAAGKGFEPLLIAIPWFLAAILSLLLVSTNHRKPRRLLLAAGWTATVIVAMIGPAAVWTIVNTFMGNAPSTDGPKGIETWVFFLFYVSWFLWAIAAGAATRSYQIRSAQIPYYSNSI